MSVQFHGHRAKVKVKNGSAQVCAPFEHSLIIIQLVEAALGGCPAQLLFLILSINKVYLMLFPKSGLLGFHNNHLYLNFSI